MDLSIARKLPDFRTPQIRIFAPRLLISGIRPNFSNPGGRLRNSGRLGISRPLQSKNERSSSPAALFGDKSLIPTAVACARFGHRSASAIYNRTVGTICMGSDPHYMASDPHYRVDEARCSGRVNSRPARCRKSHFIRDTVRLSVLAAGCWLAICNASSAQVRSVRVPIVNGGDIPFTHISLEKAPALGIVNRIVQDDQGFLWFGFLPWSAAL